MALRRRHSTPPSATAEDFCPFASTADDLSSSLAARAIRASAAHRDSSLSCAYNGHPSAASRHPPPDRLEHVDSNVDEYSSMKSLKGPRCGFWEVLAKRVKAILEDDTAAHKFEDHGRNHSQMDNSVGDQFQSIWSPESSCITDNPTLQKDAIASSLWEIGGTIKNALEEGLSIVENKTVDIIHETKKLQIMRIAGSSDAENQPTDYEIQLNNSRNVANAVAAKAKLLLRELKTVKADLAFVKQRCTQLEEENKILRESRPKGDNPADDELIRHQLETLLEEKGRLAHENSVFARENRFLREIVEYHQLTMQDVVYLDEGIEEVTEVYPIHQMTILSSPSRSIHEVSSPAILSSPPTPRSNAMLSLSPYFSSSGHHHRDDGEGTPPPTAQGSMQQQHSPPSPTRP